MKNTDTITAQDMRFNPPKFDGAVLAERVEAEYGLSGEWDALEGERDQNFRLTTSDGDKYVVKVAGPDEDPDIADFQVQALLYLEKHCPSLPVPRIIQTQDGKILSEITNEKGLKHVLRLVSYLPGIPYAHGEFPNAEDVQKIGAFQAKAVDALRDFKHPASTHFMPWNLSNGLAVSEDLWSEAEEEVRDLAAPLLDRLRSEVIPALNAGPSQIIHNDGHPWNLLRPDPVSTEVVGLIDFGDMVYAPIINDLAVSATTFFRPERNNLDAIENLLIGFNSVHPLSDEQVSLLWDAVTLRVLLMIVLSDVKLRREGEPDPDVIEEREHGIARLKIIRKLDHATIVNKLRAQCGYC